MANPHEPPCPYCNFPIQHEGSCEPASLVAWQLVLAQCGMLNDSNRYPTARVSPVERSQIPSSDGGRRFSTVQQNWEQFCHNVIKDRVSPENLYLYKITFYCAATKMYYDMLQLPNVDTEIGKKYLEGLYNELEAFRASMGS